jgi:hypothetical protein
LQPGWWADSQIQWTGTLRGKVHIWGAAVLGPPKSLEEEILKFMYNFIILLLQVNIQKRKITWLH